MNEDDARNQWCSNYLKCLYYKHFRSISVCLGFIFVILTRMENEMKSNLEIEIVFESFCGLLEHHKGVDIQTKQSTHTVFWLTDLLV